MTRRQTRTTKKNTPAAVRRRTSISERAVMGAGTTDPEDIALRNSNSRPPKSKRPVGLNVELVNLDGVGEVPDWVPDNWQDELGSRINALTEVDISTLTGAIALGWRVVACLDDENITIISPDESERLYFAPGRRQRKDRLRRTITKLAIPERLAELEEADGEVWKVMDDNPERVVPVQLIRPTEPEPEPDAVMGPYLVETKPMLARSSQGRGYQSKIAIERIWSDGSTDYKCVLCDFTRDNRLGIRGHWQKHVNSGEAASVGGRKPGESFETDVPKAATYMPRQSRINALADVIAKMLEDEHYDPDELAMAALTWVHEQTKHGTGLSAEGEELSDSERVHRIRLLLGMPDPAILEELAKENTKLIAEVTELKSAISRQANQIETLGTERDRFRERAARASGDLQSLRELVLDVGASQEEDA